MFRSAKVILCSTPILAAPDFDRPFKLEVDVSASGAGAVLLQENDRSINHPVCYFFKKIQQTSVTLRHGGKRSPHIVAGAGVLRRIHWFQSVTGPGFYRPQSPGVSGPDDKWKPKTDEVVPVAARFLDIKNKKGTENVLADALSRVS